MELFYTGTYGTQVVINLELSKYMKVWVVTGKLSANTDVVNTTELNTKCTDDIRIEQCCEFTVSQSFTVLLFTV